MWRSRVRKLFQTLVDFDPAPIEWQKRLAGSDQKIGDVLLAQNNLTEALGAYRDAISIRKMLNAKDPDNAEKRTELSTAQIKAADVLAVRGRAGGCSIDLSRCPGDPQDRLRKAMRTTPTGSVTCVEVDSKVADVLAAQTHLDEAIGIYRDTLGITTKMAVMNPADPKWRDASAKTGIKIGDVLVGKSRIDDALASYRDGLAVMKDVAANEPNNSEWQNSIATIHQRIGDAFVTETHFESALASNRDALAVIKAMLAKDAKGAYWRHAASELQLKIGQVLFSQNNFDGALAAHRGA